MVKSLPAPLMDALATTAVQVTLVQGQATISCPDEALRQTVEQLLRQHGVEIVRTETETQSLEEIFFATITAPPRL
jgi:NADH dehydrogenase FAD-containing subunit